MEESGDSHDGDPTWDRAFQHQRGNVLYPDFSIPPDDDIIICRRQIPLAEDDACELDLTPYDRPVLKWDKDVLGDPPGSLVLTCPECLVNRTWYTEATTSEQDAEGLMWLLQGAYRLRARLKEHLSPFCVRRAASFRKKTGSEMPYWISLQCLALQGSPLTREISAPPAPESVEGLTKADVPDQLPASWEHYFNRMVLTLRRLG